MSMNVLSLPTGDIDMDMADRYNWGLVLWVTGVPRITEDNVVDIMTRIRLYEALNGGFFDRYDEDRKEFVKVPIEHEWVEQRVGLSYNTPTETFASFKNRMVKQFIEETKHALTH